MKTIIYLGKLILSDLSGTTFTGAIITGIVAGLIVNLMINKEKKRDGQNQLNILQENFKG